MTTAQLKAMISGGSSRADLPSSAKGQSVTSTRQSSNAAYQKQIDRIARTEKFKKDTSALTMKDARAIIAGTRPRISETKLTFFKGEDKDTQIKNYFFPSGNNPTCSALANTICREVEIPKIIQSRFIEESQNIREQIKQREILITSGVKNTTFDARFDRAVILPKTQTVTSNFVKETIDYTGDKEFNPEVYTLSSDPTVNEYEGFTFDFEKLYSPDPNPEVKNVKSEIIKEKLVETTSKITTGIGIAVAGGIVIYLLSKKK
jgi:hypothetical protein